MKKSNIFLFLSLILTSTTLISCSSTISLAKVEESREVKLPFSEREYKSNNEFIRARANGESRDLQGGEMIARHNAEGLLANTIGTTIKGVTEQYFQNTSDNNSNDFSKKETFNIYLLKYINRVDIIRNQTIRFSFF